MPELYPGAESESEIESTVSEAIGPSAAEPPTIQESSQLEGCLVSAEELVFGWVKVAGDEAPVEISVSVDGLIFWKGIARRKHVGNVAAPEQATPACPGPYGFRVLLPDPPGDTEITTRLIRVQTTDGRDIPGSPVEVTHGNQFIGYVEVVHLTEGQVLLYGWCIDKRRPSERVRLTVGYDGQLITSVETGIPRTDLSSTGFDAPFGGFTVTIGRPADFNFELLRVVPGRSAIALRFTDDAELPNRPRPGSGPGPTGEAKQTYGMDEDVIEGTIDEIDDRCVRGWARNATNPEAMVVLDCFIDGHLFSTVSANRFRPDLAKHFKDHGFHEYRFELTPAILRLQAGKVDVRPRIGINKINHKHTALPTSLKHSRVIPARKSDYMLAHLHTGPVADGYAPDTTLIVINRNGSELLEQLFQSFHENNSYPNYEIMVVDHGSTDNSEAVARRWSRELTIRWISRGGNFSFSASNNFGARLSTAATTVFVNNDITFTGDILRDVLRCLADPTVGCVGIKLLDDSPVRRSDGQSATQHLGVHFDDRHTGWSSLAFESRWTPAMQCIEQATVVVPAVTAAFLACRRHEFLDIDGFDEAYFYGQEDVDLCLKYGARGQKVVCANHLSALHLRGFSRAKMDPRYGRVRDRNMGILESRFGAWIQKQITAHRYSRPGFWTSMAPRIAFAVTEATPDTLAGDYFTAMELASQLSAQFPCVTAFVEVLTENQYNLADFDVVIAMRDDYDPRRITKAPPHLLKIAWLRNWFERFAERDSAPLFDLVWASSAPACRYLEAKLGRNVDLVPIATNLYRFQAGKSDPALASDYCFTGSYWNLNREIVQMLDPGALPFKFALFGKGWDRIPHLAPYARGSLPYRRMPDVYASTKLVIDDANHVTKAWGAVNSRVFDAIAAGALVVTNGKSGADELFDGKLPTFDTPQALEDVLWTYLGDESRRLEKVTELQLLVQKRHTYQLRAKQVWGILDRTSTTQLRIAIKIGAPTDAVKNEWGDYHFAASMKHQFDKLGFSTRIDCLDKWKNHFSVGDHVVIVLRGLSSYKPLPHQVNLMWNISHPDKISDYEYSLYDHVFVASEMHTEHLRTLLGDRVSTLLQCTDSRFFHRELAQKETRGGLLFVGNSRGELRPIVRDAIAAGLPVEIYGGGWDGLIPDGFIKGTSIANAELGKFYASAAAVLNDHWENMRDAGFVSNRVFDVLACGGRLISDSVPGMAALFGDIIETYDSPAKLRRAWTELSSGSSKSLSRRQQNLAEEIAQHHTFATRIRDMMMVIDKLSNDKAGQLIQASSLLRASYRDAACAWSCTIFNGRDQRRPTFLQSFGPRA